MERRNFLKKLGIGTLIAGSTGIFTLNKEVKLATKLDLNNLENIDKYNKEKLIELCNDMLNAMDGQPVKNKFIYDFMRENLTKDSPYEFTDTPVFEMEKLKG